MPETKKLLVAFDPKRPNAQSSDFLIPWSWEGAPAFLSLKSGKKHAYGMIVFVGRSISENDLFVKLVDFGTFISDVDDTLSGLRKYIDQLQNMQIGDIVQIDHTVNESNVGLQLVAKNPPNSGAKRQLP